jgi:hypothetical protein
MTHLPYIIAAYALGLLVPGSFGLSAFTRMRAATRRLAAIGPQVRRPGTGPRRR